MKRLDSNVCNFLIDFQQVHVSFYWRHFFYLKILVIISSKSVSFTKLAISFLLAKFAYTNLASKFSYINLVHSCVVIYLLL